MSTTVEPQSTTTTWNIDPVHSVAEFKVKHMMISNVKGQFTRIQGILKLDETNVTNSSVEASIEAASINTREEQRDAHLKSADFFESCDVVGRIRIRLGCRDEIKMWIADVNETEILDRRSFARPAAEKC